MKGNSLYYLVLIEKVLYMSDPVPVQKPLNSVLVKPAGPDCNMGCTYCFYLDRDELFEKKAHRMNSTILRTMTEQVLDAGAGRISFGWQGGEPTLMGLDFFELALEFQQQFKGPGQIIDNTLQTNGMLIDKEWARFLRDANILTGLSLDGPEYIHDHYRKMKNGKGSWEQVVRARDIMLETGTDVNALIVVNDYSVQFPGEIYNFHRDNGLNYMQFIPCVETDRADPGSAAPFSVSAEAYGRFLCVLFDLWQNDFQNGKPATFIRFFDAVFFSYVDMVPPECTLLPECGLYVVVEHNGDVFSCDFFVDPEHRLGNVMEQDLSDMLNAPSQYDFGRAKADLPEDCTECPWLFLCRGGCPKDRIRDPRDRGRNHFCESFKMFFKHADARLKEMAENWKREQTRLKTRSRVRQSGRQIKRNDPCPCGSGRKFKECCGD